MDTPLFATWVIFFVLANLFLIITPYRSHLRHTNLMMGALSLILLILSLPIPFFTLQIAQSSFITLITIYSIFNSLVLLRWKFHANRTTKTVIKNQIVILATLAVLSPIFYLSNITEAFLVLGFALSFFYFTKVIRTYFESKRLLLHHDHTKSKKLPTVTFATPARNETHALTKHLKSVIETNYPKIEFLVLDDCSQDSTAQLIRAFSHEGVRFVKGEEPGGNWVGKTHAYDMLAHEANGQYIIFSGVDTRYEPDSIEKVISLMQKNKLNMVSIMPSHVSKYFTETLIQPIRYLLMLFRTTHRTPASLSTVWMVKRDFFEKAGGVEGYKNSINPELHLARRAAKTGSYAFLASALTLGISSRKTAQSQADTAIRSIYPSLKKSLANHMIAVLVFFFIFIFPLTSLIYSTEYLYLTLPAISLLYFSYILVILMSYSNSFKRLSPIHFVLGLFTYLYLSISSAYRYEENLVSWKDRNVCEPVLTGFSMKNPSK